MQFNPNMAQAEVYLLGSWKTLLNKEEPNMTDGLYVDFWYAQVLT